MMATGRVDGGKCHIDSLTAWCISAERYALRVSELKALTPGDTLDLIMLDHNIGDYMHGTKVGSTYDPRKMGLTYGLYTHTKDMGGDLVLTEIELKVDDFAWQQYDDGCNPRVGWRGYVMLRSSLASLPKYVTHYDTVEDDYGPSR